jgi:hypothetical protein
MIWVHFQVPPDNAHWHASCMVHPPPETIVWGCFWGSLTLQQHQQQFQSQADLTTSMWFSDGPCFFKCVTPQHYGFIFRSFSKIVHMAKLMLHCCYTLKLSKPQDTLRLLFCNRHHLQFPMILMLHICSDYRTSNSQVLWPHTHTHTHNRWTLYHFLLHFHNIFILSMPKWIKL